MAQFTTITLIIEYFAQVIEYIGILIVGISAVVALMHMAFDFKRAREIRHEFGQWILTGLEFVIAAEIILSTVVTGQQDLVTLGAVVIIRILLGYALLKEIL